MDKLFLDSSAFIKLYVPEKGSAWLSRFINGKEIIVSQLILFECIGALGRLYRESTFSKPDAIALYRQIERDSLNYLVVPLGRQEQIDQVLDTTFGLATNLRLRTLDAIHLATAQITEEANKRLTPPTLFTFISADRQLLQVAQTLGLSVENPENYP
jgi:uncharacterized protein